MRIILHAVLLVLNHFDKIRNGNSGTMHAGFRHFVFNLFVNALAETTCNIRKKPIG